MKFKCLKRFLSGSLAAMLTLSMCNMLPITAEEMDNLSYYTSLDANSEEYQNWKASMATNGTDQVSTFSLNDDSNGVYNDYLELICVGGTYSLGTTGGNPESATDDNARLLFGYPGSGTSYTTIRIDGNDYKFSPTSVTYGENVIVASGVYENVLVSLCFSLVYNQYTGRDDVAEFYYTVENTDETEHNVGVRIMFDTMLGNNDSSPFRLPGIGDITTETDLSGDDVPEFWQSFDSLTSPTVIAQGTLKMDDASTPDRVRFTNWGNATSNPWDYIRTAGTSNGDSAVCLYWNPESLATGESMSCKTYYGLSSLQQDGTPPLAVALTGVTRLEVVEDESGIESYAPNPFTVTAYVQNIGDGDAENVNVKLSLPDNMSVLDGENTVKLGDLEEGSKQYQVSWKVWVEPYAVDTVEKYSVTVSADNATSKTLKRNIEIPALQANGPLKLYLKRSNIDDSEPVRLNLGFKLENNSEDNLLLQNYLVRYYFVDETPTIEKYIDTYYCGSSAKSGIPVNVEYHKIEAPYKKQANAYLEFDFSRTTEALNPYDELQIDVSMHTDTWSDMKSSNDFSAIDNSYDGETGYILWTKMPIYEKTNTDPKRIWGTEPSDNADGMEPQVKVECRAQTLNNDSIVDMVIKVKNEGIVPIELSESQLYYYYTNDNSYKQCVNVNYVGGRIDGNWTSITDKVTASAELLETKKEKADSCLTVSFAPFSGTLCYNESVEIHLQMYNDGWMQGVFNLGNDYSYGGLSQSSFVAENILFKTKYVNEWGKYSGYTYGNSIGNYSPTYSAFKIGWGSDKKNTIDDYNAFITGMESNLNGIKYSNDATGHNFNNDLVFTNANMRAILESDIAYISGHGYFGGVLPISSSHENINATHMFTANYSVKNNQYGLWPTRENSFSFKVSENEGDINENLQWLIFGACSQLNDALYDDEHTEADIKYDDKYTYEHWLETLLSNKKMKGILGYYGDGPLATSDRTDEEVIERFLDFSTDESVYDAWIKANAYKYLVIFDDTMRCALLVKDDWADKKIYDTVTDTSIVEGETVYLYKAVLASVGNVEYKEYIVFEEDFDANSILSAVSMYAEQNDISINNCCTPVINEISRKAFNNEGEHIGDELVEYTVSFVEADDSITTFSIEESEGNLDGYDNIVFSYNPVTQKVEVV